MEVKRNLCPVHLVKLILKFTNSINKINCTDSLLLSNGLSVWGQIQYNTFKQLNHKNTNVYN